MWIQPVEENAMKWKQMDKSKVSRDVHAQIVPVSLPNNVTSFDKICPILGHPKNKSIPQKDTLNEVQ